jgi:hypothetical protein
MSDTGRHVIAVEAPGGALMIVHSYDTREVSIEAARARCRVLNLQWDRVKLYPNAEPDIWGSYAAGTVEEFNNEKG